MKYLRTLIIITVLTTCSLCMGADWHIIAKDDLGNPGSQPYLTKSAGNHKYAFSSLSKSLNTAVYGSEIELTYKDILPTALYRLKLHFVTDERRKRPQSVIVNGETLQKSFKLKKGALTEIILDIPQPVANQTLLVVKIKCDSKANAVLSYAELLSSEKQKVGKVQPNERSTIKTVDVPTPRLSPIPSTVAQVGKVKQSLDGVWKFNPAPKNGFKQLTAAADWSDINVPGEWAMQGFDVVTNSAAGYFRTFKLSNDWKDKSIKLRFNSVYSESIVYVNGGKAGSHLGGFTAFELDVTDLVKFDTINTLTLSVKNESLADSLASGTRYACHPLGGIPRSVSLIALPKVNISSLIVRTKFDNEFKNATLTALVDITNETEVDASGMKLNFELRPWKDDNKIALATDTVSADEIKADEKIELKLSVPVASPKKWNCETPNLYVLTCQLTKDGKVVETINQRFGFRDIEVKGANIIVNGMPIALRGINRHEAYPLTGRSVPKEMYRKDIEIFREGNVNLIRTCHYQPDEALMEAADELGMFIECEGPFCWAHDTKEDEKATIEATIRQNMEMVVLNRNHPSILYWSLGNESKWNASFEGSANAVAKLDPTRPMIFDTWGTSGDELCQIATKHYPGLKETYGDGLYPKQLGEFCHLNAYNRLELATDQALRDKWGIYLNRMWEAMYKDPTCAGGSIWAGIDDTFYWNFKNADGTIEERTVGYGTWGPIDGWRRKKPEFWGMKKAYSPIHIKMAEIKTKGSEIIVPIENRLDFSNLKNVKISWKIGGEAGTVSADIAPRSNGQLIIKAKNSFSATDKLELSFDDPRGFNINTFQIPLGTVKKVAKEGNEKYKIAKTDDKIVISGSSVEYTINKKTGMFEGSEFTGPYLMILPLNKEGGTQMHGPTQYYEPFTDTCSEWKATSVDVEMENGQPVLTVKGSYKEAIGNYSYTFNNDGTFTVDYNFKSTIKVNPRQVGIVFELPKSYENLSWKRKGYWTTYPEWHIARLEGTAKASYGFKATPVGPRTKPNHEWRFDNLSVGNKDFSSTKHNIYNASLLDEKGKGIAVNANADIHVRAWKYEDSIRLLIATYSNGGNERFLRRISKMDDVPLNKGDTISGSYRIKFANK